MRVSFVLAEAWTGIRRSASMALAIVLVTSVSLFFLGLGLLAQRQVEASKGFWYDRVEVSIFLCTNKSSEPNCTKGAASEQERSRIQSDLESLKPVVKAYFFESQDQAFERFKEQFKNNPAFADTPREAIPAAFRVKLSDPKDFGDVKKSFEGVPGVATVKDIRQVLEPLFRALDFLRLAAWSLAAMMLLCAVLLTATTIQQVAFSRRRETSIKRVVGASMATIQLPFMIETVAASLVGAVVAIAGLTMLVQVGVRDLAQKFTDFAWVGLGDVALIAPVIVVVALVLAAAVSWIALVRYVRV